MVLHGLPINAVESFQHNPNFTVHTFPTQLKTMLDVNPYLGIFQSLAATPGAAQRDKQKGHRSQRLR